MEKLIKYFIVIIIALCMSMTLEAQLSIGVKNDAGLLAGLLYLLVLHVPGRGTGICSTDVIKCI